MTTYRRATAADVPALARLRRDMFAEEHPDEPVPATWDPDFAAWAGEALAGWVVWVADDGGELVANAWVHVVPKVPRPLRETRSWGYLTNVFTAAARRDAGVGGALLRHVTGWAEAEGLELLLVWPSERSVPYYARAGFAPADAYQRDVAGYDA